jgi:hypothetical protein
MSSEEAVTTTRVIIIALLMVGAVIAMGLASPKINVPNADLFGFIGQLMGFLENSVGLAGKATAEWFCQKDLQDAIKLCRISPSQLNNYCSTADEEKGGTCLKAPDGMGTFCDLSWTDREKACADQNDFNSVCEKINSAKNIQTTKDLSFCK